MSHKLKTWIAVVITILFWIVFLSLTGCSSLRIESHTGFISSTVYELTDGDKLSLKYYNGDCCCIAEKVLQRAKDNIEADDELLYHLIDDKEWAYAYLDSICADMLINNELK